jgi:Tol biopolymer transport system component
VSLFSRLRERKLIQWALAYLAAAWACLQAVALLSETYEWPRTLVQVAGVLLGLGFLGVIVVAWFHGEKGRQRISILELGLLVVLAAAGATVIARTRSGTFRHWFAQTTSGPAAEATAIRRWNILLPDSAPLTFVGAAALGLGRTGLTISPDGNSLVYVAQRGQTTQLYLRELDRLDATPLQGTEGAYQPFFSPDGQWIGFFAGRHLKKLSLRSRQTVTVSTVLEPIGAAWASNGRILVAENQGMRLSWVSSAGGSPQPLQDQLAFRVANPQFVAGSDWILHWTTDGVLSLSSLTTGRRFAFTPERLVPRDAADVATLIYGTHPYYLETGHVAYISGDGVLMVLPFDFRRRAVLGPPVPVMDGVRLESETGGAQFAVSRGGTFVYAPGGNMRHTQLAWVDHASGRVDPLPFPRAAYGAFDLSPDGSRILVRIEPAAGPGELWVLDLVGGMRTRVQTAGMVTPLVRWWPDGQRVMYGEFDPVGEHADGAIFLQPVAGVVERDTLFRGVSHIEPSPDGKNIAVNEGASWLFVAPQPLLTLRLERGVFAFPAFSPNGEWLAYTDLRSAGQSEVYVVPTTHPSERHKISSDGGEEAVWSPDGSFLVYRNGQEWWRVDVSAGREFRAGRPRVLFAGPFAQVAGWSSDISPDGKRQLLLVGPHEPTATQLVVVTNWMAHVERVSSSAQEPLKH